MRCLATDRTVFLINPSQTISMFLTITLRTAQPASLSGRKLCLCRHKIDIITAQVRFYNPLIHLKWHILCTMRSKNHRFCYKIKRQKDEEFRLLDRIGSSAWTSTDRQINGRLNADLAGRFSANPRSTAELETRAVASTRESVSDNCVRGQREVNRSREVKADGGGLRTASSDHNRLGGRCQTMRSARNFVGGGRRRRHLVTSSKQGHVTDSQRHAVTPSGNPQSSGNHREPPTVTSLGISRETPGATSSGNPSFAREPPDVTSFDNRWGPPVKASPPMSLESPTATSSSNSRGPHGELSTGTLPNLQPCRHNHHFRRRPESPASVTSSGKPHEIPRGPHEPRQSTSARANSQCPQATKQLHCIRSSSLPPFLSTNPLAPFWNLFGDRSSVGWQDDADDHVCNTVRSHRVASFGRSRYFDDFSIFMSAVNREIRLWATSASYKPRRGIIVHYHLLRTE